MLAKLALLAAASAPTALACLGYEGGVPKPTNNVPLKAPIYVKAGEVYDGGWQKFDRSPSTCNGQGEGGEKDTAFVVERGGTLRNVIIGKTAGEGVYCKGGGCNLEFVWFEDVCEDAISIKEDRPGDVTNIIGGGAYHASDKVIQHNGCGRVNVRDPLIHHATYSILSDTILDHQLLCRGLRQGLPLVRNCKFTCY
jgi:hypothetical protein